MKLHGTLIEHLVGLFEMHSGHRNQQRLRETLAELDVVDYKRQTGESVVVLKDDLDTERSRIQQQ